MASQRSRAILGAFLGGLLGVVPGCMAGGYLASPPRPVAEKPADGSAGVNPAAGLEVLLEPAGAALGAAQAAFGAMAGGVVGAIIGAACGAGLATRGDDGRDAPA